MPNLQQLFSLKEKYGTLSSSENIAKDFIERSRIKSKTIQKSFSFNERNLLESFDVANGRPDLLKYFESSPKEEVVLLFIDITGFSKIIKDKTSLYLRSYLNDYYSKLIPIIYQYDGQIEKIMGDGIICVFGNPFIKQKPISWIVGYAENCAKDAIKLFKDSDKAVKVALHIGDITYYKIPSDYYEEFTMIGSPLTELYRLESVSFGDSINFYKGSKYDSLNPRDAGNIFSDINKEEVRIYGEDISLPGVDYKRLRYLKFV